MLEYDEALNLVLSNTKVLTNEKIEIENLCGRIIKEDIISPIAMPPFDKSAMDGYAVISSDLENIPTKLKCLGLIEAGTTFEGRINSGECVKIMTGAPIPTGSDSVVMVENTRQDDDFVEVLAKIKHGENVCLKGEDIQIDEKLISKDTKIANAHTAIIAAVGKKWIDVARLPKVSIVNTGGEIVPVGERLPENKIYNSNGPMLSSLLHSIGITPVSIETAQDNEQDLFDAFRRESKSNILLISGGVSMGDYDLVPEILTKTGVCEIFHKVNVKPGKPLFFGIKEENLIFGIPGNPVSNFITFYLYILPAIRRMRGETDYSNEFQTGVLTHDFKQKPGRKHFVLANISLKVHQYILSAVKCNGSGDVKALSKSDGIMIIDKEIENIKKNSQVKFLSWKNINR